MTRIYTDALNKGDRGGKSLAGGKYINMIFPLLLRAFIPLVLNWTDLICPALLSFGNPSKATAANLFLFDTSYIFLPIPSGAIPIFLPGSPGRSWTVQ
jgi:hypothetical protein